jgi:hypothetical protein
LDKKTPAQGGRNRGIENSVQPKAGGSLLNQLNSHLVRCSISTNALGVNCVCGKKCYLLMPSPTDQTLIEAEGLQASELGLQWS